MLIFSYINLIKLWLVFYTDLLCGKILLFVGILSIKAWTKLSLRCLTHIVVVNYKNSILKIFLLSTINYITDEPPAEEWSEIRVEGCWRSRFSDEQGGHSSARLVIIAAGTRRSPPPQHHLLQRHRSLFLYWYREFKNTSVGRYTFETAENIFEKKNSIIFNF